MWDFQKATIKILDEVQAVDRSINVKSRERRYNELKEQYRLTHNKKYKMLACIMGDLYIPKEFI